MATLTDVDAEAMRQRLVVKESLTQAFNELRAAEASRIQQASAKLQNVFVKALLWC